MLSDASFSKKRIYVYERSLDNIAIYTVNRGAWKSFNVWQKPGLFVLGVIHISNLPTVCVKLTQVGGWD